MSNIENNYEFLKQIKPQNISNVRANFQFKFNNYNTFYVVDTYDIIEYCFPLIFNLEFQYNSQIAVSNFLSYQFFFFEYCNKPILLKEYKVELFSYWYRLQKKIKEFLNFNNLRDELTLKYQEAENKEEKIAFIQSNVSILLSIAFGTLSKTPIERYNTLISERLQIEAIKTENKSDQLIIENILYDTIPRADIVNKNFDKFCDSSKYKLFGKTEEEKFIYLENAYRDIRVFDRIVNINKKLTSKQIMSKLQNKYNVLYLSSAQFKSDLISSYYRDYLPEYNGIVNDSLLRTNLDTYIYQLLDIGESNTNKEIVINFLDKLETVSKSYTNNEEKILKYKELFTNDKNSNKNSILKLRDIDDIFLRYHSVYQYHDLISKAIEKLKSTGDDTELFKNFSEILDKASEKQSALKDLQGSLDSYNDNLELKSEIISDINFLQKNKKFAFAHFPSKDLIRSSIQSFPVLLFYERKNIQQIQNLFQELINSRFEKQEILHEFIYSPQQLILKFQFSSVEKKLLFMFIRYMFDEKLKEEALIDDTETLIILNKKNKLTSERIQDYLKLSFEASIGLHNELCYFKTWLLRRINRNDEAIDVINEIQNNSDNIDCRLIHNRALCYKNKYYKEADIQNSASLNNYLISALNDFNFCENAYLKIFKEDSKNDLLLQTIFAVSNSIVDTYTKLYLLDNLVYESAISICRLRINELKHNLKKTEFSYSMYPAFSHTEIDLEYCEALIALEINDFEIAKIKLNAAKTRLKEIETVSIFQDYAPLEKTKKNLRKFESQYASLL